MERLLIELTGDRLDRLNGVVREAINAAQAHWKERDSKTYLRRYDIHWKSRRSQERLIHSTGLPAAVDNPQPPATQHSRNSGTFPVGQRAARSLPERWPAVPPAGS